KPGDVRDFAIVDAAMNDLIRPALYDAWHDVEAVRPRADATRRWQIVGPVCESADFLAHDRDLALAPGDLLAMRSSGAYAFAMSSNYNSRPRACEVVVDGQEAAEHCDTKKTEPEPPAKKLKHHNSYRNSDRRPKNG